MKLYGMLGAEKALAGMLYGMNPKTITTYPASAKVQYGLGLFRNGETVSNAKGSDGVFCGVAVFHQNSFNFTRGEYEEKEAVNCLESGFIWVQAVKDTAEENAKAVADGAAAYVGTDGKFTPAGTTGAVGVFRSELGDDGLALVEIIKK